MRAIAKRARVGIGTLFRHAEDKSDLLLMILNDDLERITNAALATVDPEADLLVQLLAIFGPRYEYWDSAPGPSLSALLEVPAGSGAQKQRYDRRRGELISAIAALVERQQARGRIRADIAAATIPRHLMLQYLGEARLWLRESDADARTGLAQLARTFELAIAGLAPAQRERAQSFPV